MKKLCKQLIAAILVCIAVISTAVSTFASSGKYGDINGDGSIDTKDLIRLMRYISADGRGVTAYDTDLNGDGSTDTLDLVRLMKFIAGTDISWTADNYVNEQANLKISNKKYPSAPLENYAEIESIYDGRVSCLYASRYSDSFSFSMRLGKKPLSYAYLANVPTEFALILLSTDISNELRHYREADVLNDLIEEFAEDVWENMRICPGSKKGIDDLDMIVGMRSIAGEKYYSAKFVNHCQVATVAARNINGQALIIICYARNEMFEEPQKESEKIVSEALDSIMRLH